MAVLLDILAAGVVDDSGETLDGGIVYVYQVGTTTKVAVYSDVGLTNPVSNPVTLDSAGKAEVYTATSVRLVIESSLGAAIDDIESVGIVSSANELTDDLLPDVSDARDLGSASKRLAEIHTNDLFVYDDAFIDTLARAGANNPGWINNLSIELQAGVFRVVGSDGTVLSTDNPGYVVAPSTTGGRPQLLKVTSGGSFNDDSHASSSVTNLGFGITETADWLSDMPYFLYVVNSGNTDIDGADGSSAFFISRSPNKSSTPSSASDIGDTGGIPVNDSQDVILILDDVTVANYTSLPCQLVGAFRMQWATSTRDWTVQTLGNSDGLGESRIARTLGTLWTMPVSQNGATSGKYLANNGGTAPVFTTNNYQYLLSRSGDITCYLDLNGDGGADGAGAVAVQVAMPATAVVTYANHPIGAVLVVSNAPDQFICLWRFSGAVALATIRVQTVSGSALQNSTADLTNAYFVAGARNIRGSLTFKAY